MPFKFQLLELLVNPNTVFLLFTLGLIVLGFELFNPGAILPGAIGGVSLILALFGLAQLPINVAGLLLILLAFGLFVAEAFIVSHGALAGGGVIALIFGGLLLFDTDSEAYEISVPIVIFTAALLGSFFVWVISKAVQARHAHGAHRRGGADRRARRGALAARPARPRVRQRGALAGAHGRRPPSRGGRGGRRGGDRRPHADGRAERPRIHPGADPSE